MAPFDRKYSDDMKAAIVEAVVDRKLTPAEAIAAAAAGELVAGLEAFEMPRATAANLATRERQARRGAKADQERKGTPDQRIGRQLRRGLAIVEAQLDQLDRKARRRLLDASEAELLRKMGGALRELQALDARVAPSKHTGRGARQAEPDTPDPAAGQAADLERAARATPPVPAPGPTSALGLAPAPHQTKHEHQHDSAPASSATGATV